MPNKTAEETSATIINRLESLPFYARQTLAMDNGTENDKQKTYRNLSEPNATSYIHTIHGNEVPTKILTVLFAGTCQKEQILVNYRMNKLCTLNQL